MSVDHPIHNSAAWTQQSQGCARPGDFIYLPRSSLQRGLGDGDFGGRRHDERRAAAAINADNGNQSTPMTVFVAAPQQDEDGGQDDVAQVDTLRRKDLGDEIR